MNRILWIFLQMVFALVLSSAFAQESQPQAQPEAQVSAAPVQKANADEQVIKAGNETIVIRKEPAVIYQNTSSYYRINKKLNINAQLFGGGPVKTSGPGLSVGYFIDRNSLVLLELTNGQTSYFLSNSWADNYEFNEKIKSTSLGVHFKKFTGNSFYWKIGLDYSRLTAENSYKKWSFTGTNYSTLEGNLLTASLSLGNQWQWENFTLGCDWIGIASPITQSISKRDLSGSDIESLDERRLDDLEKDLFKNSNVIALRFYVGASF